MDKRIPLAALLVLCALPASAEFCGYADRNDMAKFRDLSGPSCRRNSNALVFENSSPPYSRHLSKDGSTFVTDSWPGFMGDEQKCMNAEKGARIIGDKTKESYLLGFAPIGLQVYRYKGSCSSLKSRLMPKLDELNASNPKGAENIEEALKAVGAEYVSVRELASRLVEVGEGGYKPLD